MKQTFGYYLSLGVAGLTLITFLIAFFTPPLSGPGCTENCFVYPYLDIASRFPRDYIWMYPLMLLSLLFFALISYIHHWASENKKYFSHLAMSLALLSTGILFSNYFLQLSVIQPSLLAGEADGISLLTQFNSHGVCIALEEAGFILMSLAFLCLAPVFGKNKLEKTIRWVFIINFVLVLFSFMVITYLFGINREYRFEIAIMSLNWLTIIISGILLSKVFKINNKI